MMPPTNNVITITTPTIISGEMYKVTGSWKLRSLTSPEVVEYLLRTDLSDCTRDSDCMEYLTAKASTLNKNEAYKNNNKYDTDLEYRTLTLKRATSDQIMLNTTVSWELKSLSSPEEINNVLRNISLLSCWNDTDCMEYLTAKVSALNNYSLENEIPLLNASRPHNPIGGNGKSIQ